MSTLYLHSAELHLMFSVFRSYYKTTTIDYNRQPSTTDNVYFTEMHECLCMINTPLTFCTRTISYKIFLSLGTKIQSYKWGQHRILSILLKNAGKTGAKIKGAKIRLFHKLNEYLHNFFPTVCEIQLGTVLNRRFLLQNSFRPKSFRCLERYF